MRPASAADPIRPRGIEPVRAIALAGALALALIPQGGFAPPRAADRPQQAEFGSALQAALERQDAPAELRAFYRARDYRPLWMTPSGPKSEAYQLVGLIDEAARDGLDPADYRPAALSVELAVARAGGAAAAARAEIALSQAFTAFVRDLRTSPAEARMVFADRDLPPPTVTPALILEAAARAPSLAEHLRAVRRMNPIYEGLREALAQHRAERREGAAPDATERLILANMARARALPREMGRRFILVDAAAQQLWAYQDGQVVDTMPVVVGRRSAPTPVLAGMIRYARFNPYWNLPVTMVRDEIAPRVLREGTGFLERERMEILSDWSASARVLRPDEVDWPAVAAGEQRLRVRQLPGPHNILGEVKLMLPNLLGIYLHDTPDKSAFQRAERTLSAGCIRLADSRRLTSWVMGGGSGAPPTGEINQRMDLPEPVPVYITYFTAAPEDGRLSVRRDIYGRDAALLAALEREPGRAYAAAQNLRV